MKIQALALPTILAAGAIAAALTTHASAQADTNPVPVHTVTPVAVPQIVDTMTKAQQCEYDTNQQIADAVFGVDRSALTTEQINKIVQNLQEPYSCR